MGGQIICESTKPQLQVKYTVDLNMFPSLYVTDLLNLKQRGESGLEILYRFKGILHYAN